MNKGFDFLAILLIIAMSVFLSIPVLGQPAPGMDAPLHLSKISRLWPYFPFLPRWFPWWYCGTPLLKLYPPLMYYADISIIALFRCEPWSALGIVDVVAFTLTGCLIFLFLRKIGFHQFACLSSALLYLSSFQTLSGRFLYGHYTHTFAMSFLALGIYMAARANSSRHYEAFLALTFGLLVLSHLSVAIGFVGLVITYHVGVILAKRINARSEQNLIFPFSKSVLGGITGTLLVGFWFIPYLMEGVPISSAFMSSATTYVPPLQSLFLFDAQNMYLQCYYLGMLLILFGILGISISIYKKHFWGIIFSCWTLFFLFLCIQPYVLGGRALGYPARYPFFISFTMSLLSGVAIDYLVRSGIKLLSKWPLRALYLGSFTFILVINAIYVNPIVAKMYEPENRIAERLNPYLTRYERLASISTFSYAFNVVSNRFQIDGGYIEGDINLDFYRTYWKEIFSNSDIESTVNILRKINARLVLIYGSMPPEVEGKFTPPYFSVVLREPPITVYELNRTSVHLDFIEAVSGHAVLDSISYDDPDILEFELGNCSWGTELIVKMNYQEGWVAFCEGEALTPERDEDGLMKLTIPVAGDAEVRLQYGYARSDIVGLIVTGFGLFLFTRTLGLWQGLRTHVRRTEGKRAKAS